MSKKLGLFASGNVGLAIASFLGEDTEPLACLVVDSRDTSDYPEKHTHNHVCRELEFYSPLVTNGSYLIVFDTIIEYA